MLKLSSGRGLGLVVLGAMIFGASSAQATVNPGPFHAVLKGGRISISTFNIPLSPNGELVGSVNQNGSVSIPPSGVRFAPQTVPTAAGNLTVKISAASNVTGTIDPAQGTLSLAMPLILKAELSGAINLGDDCYIGNPGAPFRLDPISSSASGGQSYNQQTGSVTLSIANTPVPSVSGGCGGNAGAVNGLLSGSASISFQYQLAPPVTAVGSAGLGGGGGSGGSEDPLSGGGIGGSGGGFGGGSDSSSGAVDANGNVLITSKADLISDGKAVAVAIGCDGDEGSTCEGVFTLRKTTGGKSFRTRPVSYKVRAGETKVLRLKLITSRRIRQRGGRFKVVAVVQPKGLKARAAAPIKLEIV